MSRKNLNFRKAQERRLVIASISRINGKVARPPTAAEIMREKSSDKPVTLPRVKWLERPDP